MVCMAVEIAKNKLIKTIESQVLKSLMNEKGLGVLKQQ